MQKTIEDSFNKKENFTYSSKERIFMNVHLKKGNSKKYF